MPPAAGAGTRDREQGRDGEPGDQAADTGDDLGGRDLRSSSSIELTAVGDLNRACLSGAGVSGGSVVRSPVYASAITRAPWDSSRTLSIIASAFSSPSPVA